MAEALAARSCVPCRGGVPTLTREQIAPLLEQLEGWTVANDKKLTKSYRFRDFREALAFINTAGEIAEAEGHHPDLHLAWGHVGVELWTHKIGGLHENDFVMAAKLDQAHAGLA